MNLLNVIAVQINHGYEVEILKFYEIKPVAAEQQYIRTSKNNV